MPGFTLKIGAKDLRRLVMIAENALLLTMPRLGNMLLSLVVVYLFDASVWGKIVVLQVAHYLLSNIMSWGNKEFLLRSFSERPYDIKRLFQVSLTTRTVLWLPVLAVLLVIDYQPAAKLHLLIWLICQYLYQSFESITNYERRFRPGLWGETAAPVCALGVLYLLRDNPWPAALWAVTTLYLVKTLILVMAMRRYLSGAYYAFNIRILAQSGSFALLIFTGMLQSRTDVLCSIHYLDKDELAYYQILTNFLLVFQTFSTFLFQPFIKNFYRTPAQHRPLLNLRLLLFGFVLALAGVPAIALLMRYGYQYPLSPVIMGYAFIYILAPFAYLPSVYRLYKQRQTHLVILVNTLGIGSLILLFISAMHLFPLTPATALLAATVHQVLVSVLFITIAYGKARL